MSISVIFLIFNCVKNARVVNRLMNTIHNIHTGTRYLNKIEELKLYLLLVAFKTKI